MFQRVFLENHLKNHSHVLKILSNLEKYRLFKQKDIEYISSYEDIFNKVKKPYLDKRSLLNLFIAEKKGVLVKKAPEAYGGFTDHYYFIHSYNCIYECEYCYLQGYFHSPDLVFFVNHDAIIHEMKKICQEKEEVWFHGGEFSDSLALHHLTDELSYYIDFLQNHPKARLELRTKSSNIKELKKLSLPPNLFISFSLGNPKLERKTPSLTSRIQAMKELENASLAIHFDPLVYEEPFIDFYKNLIQELEPLKERIHYVSLGVVRFTKKVFQEVSKNYPESFLHQEKLVHTHDDQVKYPKLIRRFLLKQIRDLLVEKNFKNIYDCMESEI